MEAVSHSRPAVDTAELARMQMLKNIKTKFYMHKSFDLYSDLEFLPAIPSESTTLSTPTFSTQDLKSPVISPGIRNEFYNNAANSVANQQVNDILNIPKSRVAYIGEWSPKGASLNPDVLPGLKKRVPSSNQNHYTGGVRIAEPNQLQQQNFTNGFNYRNW